MVLSLCSFLLLFQPLMQENLPAGVPQIQVQKGDSNPTVFKSLNYDVTVLGFMVETVVTMELTDQDSFNQQASLLVQLPPQSVVDGFQLGIHKTMVDGVIQEKHLARIGFEEETRKRVDPGLIEWVGQDRYRIRVFPISSRLSRKLSFRYLAPLDANARFTLDLTNIERATKVHVSVTQLEGLPPLIDGGSPQRFTSQEGKPLHWQDTSQGPFGAPLVFRWPVEDRSQVMLARDDSSWQFAMHRKLGQQGGKPLPNPKRVAIFWDASQSRPGPHLKEERKALRRLLAFRNPEEVVLIPFRDRQENPAVFPNSRAGKKALVSRLTNLVYDGGTNIRGLTVPPEVAVDEVWIFSDGNDTLGMPKVDTKASVAVFAFSANKNAAWPYLEDLCRHHGGSALQWQAPSEQELFAFFSEIPSGDMYLEPETGYLGEALVTYSRATGSLFAAGDLTEHPKRFLLKQGSRTQILPGTFLDISPIPAATSWLRRFAVGRQMEKYHREPEHFREELLNLGQDHGLVTAHTSLIVFETKWQYASNGLAPPENAPFDTSDMSDLEPDEKDLQRKKTYYFERVARTWAHRKQINNYVAPAKKATGAKKNGVLTEEELTLLPAARDPWAVLCCIPAVQTDRLNVGGSESSFVSTSGSVVLFTDVPENAENAESDKTPGTARALPWQMVEKAVAQIRTEKKPYQTYLTLKSQFQNSPSFHYQTAQFLAETGEKDLARRVATNLLEQGWEDDHLLKGLGMLCHDIDALDLAEVVYQKLSKSRPEWPQVRMFLAQILREKALLVDATDTVAATQYYQRAFEINQQLLQAPWGTLDTWDQMDFLVENRFPNLLIPVIEEALWLQMRLKAHGQAVTLKLPPGIDASLADIQTNLRILLWWDNENADLHFSGGMNSYATNCYRHGRTPSGVFTRNQSRGFGPNVYASNLESEGENKLSIVRYRGNMNRLLGPVYFKLEIWKRFGYPDEAYRVEVKKFQESTHLTTPEVPFCNKNVMILDDVLLPTQ